MKRNYYIVALIMLTFFVISFLTNVIGARLDKWLLLIIWLKTKKPSRITLISILIMMLN